ncbi:hypothetical protein E2C01_081246 [Portunus trituberculatus]|uniref:Uncharacterized protein n=1 Tax=Portunus trituberculatus TaxID=210409 RepID=A0A5B7IP98_PORTR|nr:hypothetical protein [Portunus trituberculatus]
MALVAPLVHSTFIGHPLPLPASPSTLTPPSDSSLPLSLVLIHLPPSLPPFHKAFYMLSESSCLVSSSSTTLLAPPSTPRSSSTPSSSSSTTTATRVIAAWTGG